MADRQLDGDRQHLLRTIESSKSRQIGEVRRSKPSPAIPGKETS